MKIFSAILTVTLLSFITTNAFAFDFFGATVIDKEVPSSVWKIGILGLRPTVKDVTYDSLAKKAGLTKGDLILAINDKPVKKTRELNEFSENTLKVKVFSGAIEKTLAIDRLVIGTEKTTRSTAKKEAVLDRTPEKKSEIPAEQQEKMPIAAKKTTTLAPAQNRDVVDELVEVAGHRRDFDDLFGHSSRGDFEQLLSDAFSPEVAEKTFKRFLARKLDRREISTVLTWYKTPVGQKVVEADSILDFNRRNNRSNYVSTQSGPGFKERMNLAGQIEREICFSELEMKRSRQMIRRIIKAIPADYPNAKGLKEEIQGELSTLEEKRKENTEKFAYNYRGLSLAELRDYLKFLRSVTGRKYIAAVNEAAEEIFKKVAEVIEKDFREYVL